MMDYAALERTIQAAMAAAKTAPGPYGGRYVGRLFNKEKQETEFLDLGTDDMEEVEKAHPGVDVLVQCRPDKTYPMGAARRWIKEDGTVNHEYLNGSPQVKPAITDLTEYDAALARLIRCRTEGWSVVYADKAGSNPSLADRRMMEYRDQDRYTVAEATVDSVLFGATKSELKLREQKP